MHIKQIDKDVPEDFLLNHLVKSFSSTIMWWINNKAEFSPEEIASYFVALIR